MRWLPVAAAFSITVTGMAYAQTDTTGVGATQEQPFTALPQNAMTVTNWLKKNVYDRSDNLVGEIADVLVNRDGKIEAFIMSIGGLTGPDGKMGVVVPFGAVNRIEKNGKWFLTMDASKEALRTANIFKFDRAKGTWIPE
jgi:sporulation protein YlmC with PRC-barrel domain